MSYKHSGAAPVIISKHPLDPDSTDWIYFVYEDWLRTDETITASSAVVTGAEMVSDSTLIGDAEDEDGVTHSNVYGVQVKPSADSFEVTIAHRVSTETSGPIDLGRLDMDRTVTISVETL